MVYADRMLKPEFSQAADPKNTQPDKWKKLTQTVKRLNIFRNAKRKTPLQMETLENKFCSDGTKQELSRGNTLLQIHQAAFYTKPSQQADSLSALPNFSTRHNPLPPLTSHTSRMASCEDGGKAIQRRIKRRRSTLHGHSLSHQGSNIAMSTTPRVLTQEDKFRLRMKFKGLVRVFLVFKKIWMFHKGRVDEILQTFKGLDSLVRTAEEESDMLFNVSHYKAKKQSIVSLEVKRILSKHPTLRTAADIHSLIVFMGSYDTLAEYPLVMQRMIAEKAWYEWYDAKRVIAREGHVAYNFFYVLSGSAVMTSFDQQSTQSKTVKFIGRGDSFGEECLMHGRPRECTTISKEVIELLVLKDEDFTEIFMSAGLRKKDAFFETLSFMQGWPVELLQTGTRGVVFTYFKKGAVVVNDSRYNDSIYIVKSGSCGVIKKLKGTELEDINLKLISGKHSPVKASLVDRASYTDNHSVAMERSIIDNKLQAILDDQACNKEELAYYDPDIHIPLNGILEEVKTMKRQKLLPPIRRAAVSFSAKELVVADEQAAIEAVEMAQQPSTSPHTSAAVSILEDIVEEDEMSTEESGAMKSIAGRQIEDVMDSLSSEEKVLKRQLDDSQSVSSSNCSTKKCSPDVFITVQHLTSGSHFGLIEAIADRNFIHPSLSLVSHGAECVIINKKLFMEKAPLKLLDKLREQLFPYPSDERLQQNLEVSLYWDKHRQQIIDSQLSDLKSRNTLT